MAKAPLTRETAGIGDVFTSADGRKMQKILSPYANDGKTTTVVALGAHEEGDGARLAPKIKAAAPKSPKVDPAVEIAPVSGAPAMREPLEKFAAPSANPVERFLTGLIATPAYGAELPADPTIDADTAYTRHTDTRDEAATDQEAETVHEEAGFWDRAAAAGKDVAKGLLVEGVPAAIGGAKKAFNSTMDLIDDVADNLPEPIISWSGDAPEAKGVRFYFDKPKNLKARGLLGSTLPRLGIGDGEKPETTTGKAVQGISQFTAGMFGGGNILKGWKVASAVGGVAKAMASGAIADFTAFDGHEERLSNLLAEIAPDAAKPVFEYLSANEDDPELLGRAKNAVEGLGLGVIAESFGHALRVLRAGRKAKAAAQRAAAAEGVQVPIDMHPDDLAAAAEEEIAHLKKLQEAKPKFSDKVAKQTGDGKGVAKLLTNGEPGENVFNLKLGTMETADDIKATVVKLAKKYEKDVDAARRGVRTWDQTGAAADNLDWVQSMAERKTGDAMNAETILAYREVMNGSAHKLLDLAHEVVTKPTIAAQAAFRESLATHRAIQLEFMGARAEAGRALNAFKIPAGTPAQNLRQLDAMLADMGGESASKELAEAVLKAARKGDQSLNQFVTGGWMAKSRDAIRFVYTNGLMSGAGTPVANVIGNTIATVGSVMNRVVAPRLAQAADGVSDTEIGEATAMLAGQMGAMKDLLQTGLRDFVTNFNWQNVGKKGLLSSIVPDVLPEGLARTTREETARTLPKWYPAEDTMLGKATDAIGVVGKTVLGAPSDANAAADGIFRTIAARGSIHADAFRIASREAREGGLSKVAMRERMADLTKNPTPDMLANAEREMQELTFSRAPEPGSFAQSAEKLRRRADSFGPVPIGTIIAPFIRTPTNIVSAAMRYSPLAHFSARFRDALNAGGAEAELAKAQMAVGTAVVALMYDMAANGDLTGGGPKNPAQKAALTRQAEDGTVAWQPYSARLTIGNKQMWVDMNRIEPLATAMSMVGDYAEIMHNDDWDDAKSEQMSEINAHLVGALGQAFFRKTMLTSVMEWANAFSGNDPARAQRFFDNLPDKFVPMSGLRRTMRKFDDPYMRDTSSAIDAIRNNMPGMSTDLPVARDLWGAPKSYQSGLGVVYDAVSPVKVREAGGTTIDAEILRLAVPVQMPSKSLSVNGDRVSLKNRPDIYNELVEAAGKPAFEHLEAVVTGAHPDSEYYLSLSDGPDGEKSEYIKDVIKSYRKAASAQIEAKYADQLGDIAAAHDLAQVRAAGQ